jgi:hypothetical protein
MAIKGQKFKEWTSEEKYKTIEPLLKMESYALQYKTPIEYKTQLGFQ